ncbi:cupin domain-containing protein [Photobacterium sp. TY1-4]|uniref:cupin domain-containing protein n=1 Tax=Photobacterium sp. TY1-4 TaxID=2899122 RepID=UPI0021BFA6A7|nr:cupin domain-containing protein [Photobacterium sp. TY1-4]UXH99982.1 cupin domain-containing protein [Photobacterium sp. TY1-4]
MPKAKIALEIEGDTFNPFPEPLKTRLGSAECRSLGDSFGLSQFGVNLEVLQPGAQSALRHWHTESDEFLYVLSGALVLVTDEGEQTLQSGMCVGFPAGKENGHHLINRSSEIATFIVVGSRVNGDEAVYPDDDFKWVVTDDGAWIASRKDGTPYR